MRFCYAHRKFSLYPQSVDTWDLAASNYTDDFLKKTKDLGFDALEVGLEVLSPLGEQGAKDAGRWRLEGKEYVVQDGDVVHFRFNV